ncbi:MAG: adenosylcobinamide-GDP ribazoletransferase [Ectothiorhodospiraceae bacterium]|nr:adenosylcobinamide-GDP ribazoletransferase [Ectothiorhodospiraceae bacterium]
MLHAFAVALTLLTRLPVRLRRTPDDRSQGLAVAMYPLVGLVLGALMWLLAAGLDLLAAPSLLSAILLVTLWVAITGALHLDGLADSADAWLGAHGDRERALRIMKDPACGPAGVVSLLLVLLLKTAAITALLDAAAPLWWLLAAPVLGRGACAALFLCLPYVRDQGLGATAAGNLRRRLTWGMVIGTGLVVCVPVGLAGIVALACAALCLGVICRGLRRWLGGFTGDTAGATLELVETATLVALALTVTAQVGLP